MMGSARKNIKPNMDIKMLQLNAMCSRYAMDMCLSTALKKKADIILVSEPNKKMCADGTWYADPDRVAAIRILSKNIPVYSRMRCPGAVFIDLGDVAVISMYLSPNKSLREFESGLDRVSSWLRIPGKNVIVTGDFNAKSPLWGGDVFDRRGRLLTDWACANDLHILNDGLTPTFERGTYGSFLDLTLVSSQSLGRISGWCVLDVETLSNHRCISFVLARDTSARAPRLGGSYGWRYVQTRRAAVCEALCEELLISTRSDATALTNLTIRACQRTLRPRQNGRRTNAYWWTPTIAGLHKDCVRARRSLQRANRFPRDPVILPLQQAYKAARTNLKRAIVASKRTCWDNLCREVDGSPFGDAYRIVMRRYERTPPVLPAATVQGIVAALFPTHEPVRYEVFADQPCAPFGRDELISAASKIKPGKSGGPDGVPPDVIKLLASEYPDDVLRVMNRCLEAGEFPRVWKHGRLVLVRKNDKHDDAPSSFRPLCLLNVLGKLLEHLVLGRLCLELCESGGLSERQYGFRAGMSTIGACSRVVTLIREARSDGLLPALVLLDVRNAFNSASWKCILLALRSLNISPYIRRIIQSYLQERSVVINTAEGEQTFAVNSGVPQGSVLGPTLWNILYDGLLRAPMPAGAELVAYADDLALFVKGSHEEEVEDLVDCAMTSISRWMLTNQLQLAPEKTEAIVVSGRREIRPIVFNIQGRLVSPKREVRYLGIWLDHRLSFVPHVSEVSKKALKSTRAIARMMANRGSLGSDARRVLASVTTSILLYGVPVWGAALGSGAVEDLESVQRQAALRVCSAYRTVSKEAVLVLASMLPLKQLIAARMAQAEGQPRSLSLENALRQWQLRWNDSATGSWTRRLIPDIGPWLGRRHGLVDFHLTQVLSGHGCFGAYLCRMGLRTDALCEVCDVDDTAEHTFFLCTRWEAQRAQCYSCVGTLTPDTLVPTMLRGQMEWSAIQRFCKVALSLKNGV